MGHIVLISCCICCFTGIRLIIKDIGISLKDKIESLQKVRSYITKAKLFHL